MLETTDFVVVGFRALAFIAVFQAAGCALYTAICLTRIEQSRTALSTVTFLAALFAIGMVVLHHAAEPARMTASISGIWDSGLQLILLQSDAGTARALRILGLATIAWGAVRKSELHGSLLLIGAVLVLFSYSIMGHTASHPQRWLLSALLVIHLLVAAFWFGALSAFLIAGKRETPAIFAGLVREFSQYAGWLIPSIALVGFLMAIVLLPDIASLATPYGRLLIAKFFGFILLMALAAWNKFRLVPGLVMESDGARVQFRRVVRIEWAVIAIVLAVTATMTGLFGPE